MIKYLKFPLWPFSLVYGATMAVRNRLYDTNLFQSEHFGIPVIAVGNLALGGTGKTPHIEYLIRLLQPNYKVATLSRGYKRKTKGFLLADEVATAAALGDESYQYYRDFKAVTVAVCEDRVKGINKLISIKPETEVVLLDDAMQHRPVRPSLNILITDFNRPFYNDLVVPAGYLREFRTGAKRAQMVIVSKCPPALDDTFRNNIENNIKKYTGTDTPVFFTSYSYGQPIAIGNKIKVNKRVLLVTGIANAEPLKHYLLNEGYELVEHIAHPDHHQFSSKDILSIKQLLSSAKNRDVCVFTTRKDAVKLIDEELLPIIQELPLFYIPIEVAFLNKGDTFDSIVIQHVKQKLSKKKP